MIYVDNTRCRGCGECVSICPTGAITLLDDKAFINEALCEYCQICMSACPQHAILSVETVKPVVGGESLPNPEPMSSEVLPARLKHVSPPLGSEVLPAVGSILISTGREVVPRLASLAIDLLDQRIRAADHKPQIKSTQSRQRNNLTKQTGRRRRRRRRRQGN